MSDIKNIRIGVCLKAEDNTFWSQEVRRGIEEAADLSGQIEIQYQSPSSIGQHSEQQKIIRQWIANRVDAIILAPSEPTESSSLAKEILEAGIKLLILDTDLRSNEARLNYNFLGFDDYQGGVLTGKALLEKLTKNQKVAIISGYKFGSYSDRERGFIDTVQDKLQVVAISPGNFDEREAFSVARMLLKVDPEISAIFATSDNMALGCRTAAQSVDRSDLLICGFDATYAGKLAIERGQMLSTVDVDPQGLGREAVRLIQELVLGRIVEPRVIKSVRLLTKQNVTALPKQAIQKRRYEIVEAQADLSEFPYAELGRLTVCPIVLGQNYLTDLAPRLKELEADRFYIVTDSNVRKLYGDQLLEHLRNSGMRANLFDFPAGEPQKTFTTLNSLAHAILESGISKRSCLLVLGGGVVGNIAGFLAAILMRGVRFVHVPTTVMAQIDSSTGGKQAINMPQGKNLLGTFYEPEFIYLNPGFIETLPIREYRAGIAEAIKHGFCHAPEILDCIQVGEYRRIMIETIRRKCEIMARDPREKEEGLILVYGHTIGHALETVCKHKLNHGEAISIGMVAAAELSAELGFADQAFVDEQRDLLGGQGLPTTLPHDLDVEAIIKALYYDKKERKDQVPFILLRSKQDIVRVNGSFAIPVSEAVVRGVLG